VLLFFFAVATDKMRKQLAAIVCLGATALPAVADLPAKPIEKRIGDRIVRLPILPGFIPACEENSQLAQRAQLMTPKTWVFLTCFVDGKAWRDFFSGKSADHYPLIAVTVQEPTQGGDFTPAEFEKLRAAAHKQLGSLVANNEVAQQQLAEQDRKLAASGVPVTRGDHQQTLQGFFEIPGVAQTISYVAIRSASVSETGATKYLNEVNAVSIALYSGKLFALNVVDQSASNDQGRRAQEIAASWLRAFRESNEGSGK
jgi:hypothetical protein